MQERQAESSETKYCVQ